MEGDKFEAWAADAVRRRWPQAKVERIAALRGDMSTRRFWRLTLSTPAPATAILVDLGPDDLPRYVRALNLMPHAPAEPPWINVHRFLTSIGAPVPSLYEADAAERAMLVEDVGEVSLFDAARRPGADAADLFRLAVEELIRIHVDGTRALDAGCIASAISYDGRLFEWEMKEFVEIGLATVAPRAHAAAVVPELAALAARLDGYPRVLSHRDYAGQNLFVQDGPRIRIIDFQDALMAPPAQDLAVLLTTRDTAQFVTPAIERRLLDFYVAGLARRSALDFDVNDFSASYRLCVLQHALKMIGRFELFERQGKPGHAAYIPHALRQARRMLAQLPDEFPRLRSVMGA